VYFALKFANLGLKYWRLVSYIWHTEGNFFRERFYSAQLEALSTLHKKRSQHRSGEIIQFSVSLSVIQILNSGCGICSMIYLLLSWWDPVGLALYPVGDHLPLPLHSHLSSLLHRVGGGQQILHRPATIGEFTVNLYLRTVLWIRIHFCPKVGSGSS
jgi:hypothetical protein